MRARPWIIGVAIACLASASAAARVGAQQEPRANRPRANASAGPDAPVTPAEIQQLFDGYVVMQAQQALSLTDEQYAPFLTRMRALQDVRRRAEVERTRRIQALRRYTNDPASTDADLRAQLKELRDFNERAAADEARAEDAVLQGLTTRQQARYHLFQEMMERRKVELLMRARQGSRRQ